MDKVQQGRDRMGLRWAQEGCWRIAVAADGACRSQRRVEGIGWCALADKREMPAEVEARLLDALGLPRG